MTGELEGLPVDLRLKRGACADCGYYGWINAETGGLIKHAVRRVRLGINGEAERYESLALGDDVCSGTGRPAEPLPKLKVSDRIAA